MAAYAAHDSRQNMAVFTPLNPTDVQQWLRNYELGDLLGLEGISSGIENTNFFLDTSKGRFVLTLFERLSASDLPFYLELMRHLAARGIPCPDPIANRRGSLLGELKAKPAAIVTRLSGHVQMQPDAALCAELGATLARMHLAAADYPGRLPNPRGRDWWLQTAPRVLPFLTRAQADLLQDELGAQARFAASSAFAALPGSAVHADLFRDNVLVRDDEGSGPRLGGIIDFYFAGVDSWLYDLAVTVNDWCIDDRDASLIEDRLAAFLAAYRAVRPPQAVELECWPMMLRAAGLRFWLSRLFDLHLPRPAQIVNVKDPGHFERLLTQRRTRVVGLG